MLMTTFKFLELGIFFSLKSLHTPRKYGWPKNHPQCHLGGPTVCLGAPPTVHILTHPTVYSAPPTVYSAPPTS